MVTEMSFDPHECTRHFGVKPTHVLTKGEIRGKGPPARASFWSVQTKWSRFDSTDAPLKLLLDLIWSKRKRIRDYSVENKLELTFVVNIQEGLGKRNFVYEFSSSSICQISYFNVPLGLDVY